MPGAAVTLEVDGDEELTKQVAQVPDEAQDRLEEVFKKYAMLIERDAKNNLRRNNLPGVDDGQLWNSVKHLVLDATFAVFSKLEYAIYVHEGTGKYAREGGGRQTPWVYFDEKRGQFFVTEGMPANPFLEDAFNDHKGKLLSELKSLNAEFS